MKFRQLIIGILCILLATGAKAGKIFIPMDATGQKNHLKAYGIAYAAMKEGIKIDWLLNYKGGSFAIDDDGDIADLCAQRGVTYKSISEEEYENIVKTIKESSFNGQVIKLEKAPRIAVYTPLNKEPWDDAVTMALTYAEIPFDKLYADEVLAGDLAKYDWLHLHHEDFTGQYGKFWISYRNTSWYQNDKSTMETIATNHGFGKVSALQLAVVKKIKDFVASGGNLFAMCSATETFDIALAADGLDICDTPFDGDPPDKYANGSLDYDNCFAFKGFTAVTNPFSPAFSDIDFSNMEVPENQDYFTLIARPAKENPVAAMLCQNHVTTIKGFMGQTTAFRKALLKSKVMILGENLPINGGGYIDSQYNNGIKYIHGVYGKGTWTFYGGHDPESYKHLVGAPPTDLNQFPNSPGYRLILNNVLLPAANITPSLKNTSPVSKTADTTSDNVKMYSDPEDNELIFIFTPVSKTDKKNNNVTLVNASGKEVFNQSYSTPKVSVDLNNLPAGMYTVKVNSSYVGKVAKE